MTKRVSWDDVWMSTARTLSRRSRCDKTQCGCVLVSADNSYIAVGYNGPAATYKDPDTAKQVVAGGLSVVENAWPLGVDATCSTFCARRMTNDDSADYSTCPSIHAEINALIHADHSQLIGGTAYVTSVPCINCAHALCNSGVTRILCIEDREYRPAEPIIALCAMDGVRMEALKYFAQVV
jgi:dCMP deaminase